MHATTDTSVRPTGADTPAAPALSVLCVGNGGIVSREGRLWTERTTAGFLAELASAVEEVCYFAWHDHVDDQLSQTCLQDVRGLRVVALLQFRGALPRRLRNGGRAIAVLLREIARADFVYLFWPGRVSSIAARLCRAVGKPYGIYLRGEQIPPDPAAGAAFGGARFVLAAGGTLGETAAAHCHDVENVVPMTALRLEHLTAPRTHRAAGPVHLLYVGRLEERKGVYDLLAAADLLAADDVAFTLTLIGQRHDAGGALEDRMTAPARLRVRVVEPLDRFEDLIPHYQEADIFVFPSHDEGFPRVLYEAMAFRLPVITTFVGSIPSVMRDGANCLHVRARHPGDIADKVRQLASDPGERARLAASGHQVMVELLEQWDGRSHATQVIERLRALAARARRMPA
jgi:glycosyltransferase involved in cell wall biosynthesis